MDIPDWNPRQVQRSILEDGPDGPFGHAEPLPYKMQKWVSYIDKETKLPRELLMFDWQRTYGSLFLDSIETYTHEWTLQSVKRREAFDKQDTRDQAQSLFTLDRNGEHRTNGRLLFDLRVLPAAPNPTVNALAALEAALVVAQTAAIDLRIADANDPVVEANRTILNSYGQLTAIEFGIFDEYRRVYDAAMCHFLFKVISPQVKRFLNAARITAAAATVPVVLDWQMYRKATLDRLPDGAASNDFLTYFLRPREDALPVALWLSERRSERSLIEKEGVTLPETMWLDYTLSFISSEERQLLKVPADKDISTFNAGAGYQLSGLETAVATTDPDTFRKFRQQHCKGNLARRTLQISRLLVKDESSSTEQRGRKSRKSDEKASHSSELTDNRKSKSSSTNRRSGKSLTGEALKKLDLPASLPQRDGNPDQERYNKWKEGSLRRRLWDLVKAKKCVRCSGDHLRSACTEEPKSWEPDFNEGPSFWDPPLRKAFCQRLEDNLVPADPQWLQNVLAGRHWTQNAAPPRL